MCGTYPPHIHTEARLDVAHKQSSAVLTCAEVLSFEWAVRACYGLQIEGCVTDARLAGAATSPLRTCLLTSVPNQGALTGVWHGG
jgi:hypothetical protein